MFEKTNVSLALWDDEAEALQDFSARLFRDTRLGRNIRSFVNGRIRIPSHLGMIATLGPVRIGGHRLPIFSCRVHACFDGLQHCRPVDFRQDGAGRVVVVEMARRVLTDDAPVLLLLSANTHATELELILVERPALDRLLATDAAGHDATNAVEFEI